MEQEEIVTLIKSVMEETKTADDFAVLQKKYDALLASTEQSVETPAPETDVNKSLSDKVDALTAELKEMRTTPIQKGVQDGEVIVEKNATDITSIIMANHYGGA